MSRKSNEHRDRDAEMDESEPDSGQVGAGSEGGGQSGDTQGLAADKEAADESVEELAEDDQAYEAGVIEGVEDAGDHPERSVRSHENLRPAQESERHTGKRASARPRLKVSFRQRSIHRHWLIRSGGRTVATYNISQQANRDLLHPHVVIDGRPQASDLEAMTSLVHDPPLVFRSRHNDGGRWSSTKERVRCGLVNARANGKQLGRPRRVVSNDQLLRLKAEGRSLREIADKLSIGYGTVRTRLAKAVS